MGQHLLDSLDKQILDMIADNARVPFLEVARACNVSGAAIHQRIQKLTKLGIIQGSNYILNPDLFYSFIFHIHFFIWWQDLPCVIVHM